MTTTVDIALTSQPNAADPRLALLRERIATVRRGRSRIRLLTAFTIMALAVVAAVVAVFLADWLLALPRSGRAIGLVAAAASLAWVWRRRVRPWLAVHESDLDLALLVEREQGVDSDLVAALQFESPAARGWGSGDLRAAVVDYVGEFGRDWEVPRQVAGAMLRRRLAWLAAAVAAIAAGAACRPDFAAAFLNRLALGSMHYPTRTRFESLSVAGQPVQTASWQRQRVASPLGQTLAVDAELAGAVPESGRVRLTGVSDGSETEIELNPDPAAGPRRFAAKLPRLLEPVDVQVLAGDAWTDPIRVDIVPLPIIEITLAAEPPAYARNKAADAADRAPANARQISVLEGSRVTVRAACGNKRLTSAVVSIDGQEFPLAREPAGEAWAMPAGTSPLDDVVEPLQFELVVVDADGLRPERPITGIVRIKADAAPQVWADIHTRLALPTATPVLEWKVDDDHGIGEISILLEPFPADAEGGLQPAEPRTIRVPSAGGTGRTSLSLAGSTPLPLGSLGLKKGDQVRVTLQATDTRGEREGRTAASEPLVIDVTDEAGLLASLLDDDERSARQIDAILERQLEVGSAVPPPRTPPRGQGGSP